MYVYEYKQKYNYSHKVTCYFKLKHHTLNSKRENEH